MTEKQGERQCPGAAGTKAALGGAGGLGGGGSDRAEAQRRGTLAIGEKLCRGHFLTRGGKDRSNGAGNMNCCRKVIWTL